MAAEHCEADGALQPLIKVTFAAELGLGLCSFIQNLLQFSLWWIRSLRVRVPHPCQAFPAADHTDRSHAKATLVLLSPCVNIWNVP